MNSSEYGSSATGWIKLRRFDKHRAASRDTYVLKDTRHIHCYGAIGRVLISLPDCVPLTEGRGPASSPCAPVAMTSLTFPVFVFGKSPRVAVHATKPFISSSSSSTSTSITSESDAAFLDDASELLRDPRIRMLLGNAHPTSASRNATSSST